MLANFCGLSLRHQRATGYSAVACAATHNNYSRGRSLGTPNRQRIRLQRQLTSDVAAAAAYSSAPVAAMQEMLGAITYTTGM